MPVTVDQYEMYARVVPDMAAETTDARRRASLLEMTQMW